MGHKVAGIDYSSSLIINIQKAIPEMDFRCCEAIKLDVSNKFDIAISNSVFQYFESYEYAKTVINKNGQEKWFNITSTNKKLEILEQNGIDYVWLVPFDNDFANITAQYFMDNYIIEYFKPEDIIIGYDHHFGNKREGNAEFLTKHSEKYNYKLHVVEPSKIHNISISSTQIRQFIEKCNVESANNFLGWNYELSGQIVKGNGVGNKIKFPTANVNPENKNQLIPGKGAYCVDVLVDNQKYLGMCNIGVRQHCMKKVKL